MRFKRKITGDIIRWCVVVGIIAVAAFAASRFHKSDDDQAVNAEILTSGQEGKADGEDDIRRGTYGDTDENDSMEKYTGTELSGLTIILDAGHGGKDNGASSMGSTEKEINLSIEKKIAELLESCGAGIIETRSDDTYISLKDRVDIANDSGAALFLSVHCNYYDTDASMNGFQCFYGGGSIEGEAVANSITEAIERDGICSTKHARSENYYVVCNTTMTSVLMELGYMSNRTECVNLLDDEYQGKLARSIVKGVIEWYGNFENRYAD